MIFCLFSSQTGKPIPIVITIDDWSEDEEGDEIIKVKSSISSR